MKIIIFELEDWERDTFNYRGKTSRDYQTEH